MLQHEIAGDQNPYVLGIAFNSGLVEPSDLPRLRDLDATATQLLDVSQRGRRILSVQQNEYAIRALVMLDQLDETERDLLKARLLATLRDVDILGFYELVDALVCTRALAAIDRPCDETIVLSSVHKMLLELQRVQFHLSGRSGGFSTGRDINSSDELATVAAVQLMQSYGVPGELDVMSLRSYLRPSMSDYLMKEQAFIRAATKQRLESLPGISRLTWWDYAHYETGLWMSLMIVLLCLCATFGSPKRSWELGHIVTSRRRPARASSLTDVKTFRQILVPADEPCVVFTPGDVPATGLTLSTSRFQAGADGCRRCHLRLVKIVEFPTESNVSLSCWLVQKIPEFSCHFERS